MYTGALADFLNMGGSEVMFILVIVLLLFGGKKLPELARGLGKGIRDFKDASEGVKREIHRNINSAGLVDEIDAVISDTHANNNKRYPYEPISDEQRYPETEEHKTSINFDKTEAIVHNDGDDNSKIETDKTKL